MEGKKYKSLSKDDQAVSEVIGQVLMIGVVVIAFASIAVTIFSNDVIDPPHTPRVDLEIYPENTVLCIFHVGGEAIDLNNLKIVLSKNGVVQGEFTDLNNYAEKNNSNDGVLGFGEYIKIDTGISLINNGSLEIMLVHIPSQQVILKSTI